MPHRQLEVRSHVSSQRNTHPLHGSRFAKAQCHCHGRPTRPLRPLLSHDHVTQLGEPPMRWSPKKPRPLGTAECHHLSMNRKSRLAYQPLRLKSASSWDACCGAARSSTRSSACPQSGLAGPLHRSPNAAKAAKMRVARSADSHQVATSSDARAFAKSVQSIRTSHTAHGAARCSCVMHRRQATPGRRRLCDGRLPTCWSSGGTGYSSPPAGCSFSQRRLSSRAARGDGLRFSRCRCIHRNKLASLCHCLGICKWARKPTTSRAWMRVSRWAFSALYSTRDWGFGGA
jgi:hypothetical protein